MGFLARSIGPQRKALSTYDVFKDMLVGRTSASGKTAAAKTTLNDAACTAGDTVFTAAVPIQTAFNASWSNIIEHLKLAGNARLVI